MNRRNALKTLGIAGVGAAGAGAGFVSLFGTAEAGTVSSSLTVANADPVTSDDGSILYVEISGSHGVHWNGLDSPATHIRNYKNLHYTVNNKTYDINDTGIRKIEDLGGDDDKGKTGTEGYFQFNFSNRAIATDGDGNYDGRDGNNGDGTNPLDTPAPVSPLEVDSDGSARKRTVTLTEHYSLYSGSDKSTRLIQSSASDDFYTTIKNQEGTANVGGDIKTGSAAAGSKTD